MIPSTAPPDPRPGRRTRLLALAATGTLVSLMLLSGYLLNAVPAPAGAGVAAERFSAERAYRHLTRITGAPHPSGTDAADTVRGYVTEQLTGLGLQPAEADTVADMPVDGWAHLLAQTRNVVATVPGRGGTGRVILVAHTDSVAISHGASDDGLGVATLLEVARALRAAPALRNDVTLLFTDGEEFAQLGAKAYVRSDSSGRPADTVVLNLEARGTSGRLVMFETGPGSAGVLGALDDRVPIATSLAAEIYRLLPNDTDFTRFRAAGYAGMNFAVIGGSARYHTARDDLAAVDRGSLQDMGDTVLAATRTLGGRDLTAVAGSGEATWFTVGPWLVRYPAWAVLPLAVLAAVAVGAAFWYGGRRRAIRLRPAGLALASFPGTMLVAGALGWALWRLLCLLRPAYGRFPYGDPYQVAAVAAGLLLLATAVTWLWLVLAHRRVSAPEIAAGLLGWLAALALLTAVAVPGAAYLFTWSALAGAGGLAAAVRTAGDAPWRPVLMSLSALPAALVLAPLLPVLLHAVGLAAAAAVLVLVPLLAGALLPAAVRSGRRAGRSVVAALCVASALLVAGGAAASRTDRVHPLPVSLMYTYDADTGQAQWVSADVDPDHWVSHYVGAERASIADRFPNLWGPPGGFRVGPAPPATLARPSVRLVADERDGENRRMRLRLRAESSRPILLALYVDTSSATVTAASVGTAAGTVCTVSGGQNVPAEPAVWKWGVMFAAPPDDGFELSIDVHAPGPVRLLALAQDRAVPEESLDLPLPDDRTWSATGSGLAFASRTYVF
ncbi:M20/M25/M40 family metallo-hydrolase [Dactylosporangium sp. NPDC048998]|uniref:M20/M25/M40 family metallo-hydrolase n=1 Tax=Dactylosporangium sp. NPDC048998 TaxID=3363976 RepID=UPI0037114DF8